MESRQDGSFVVQNMTADEIMFETLKPHKRHTVFRGHSDSSYRLVPRALRNEKEKETLYKCAKLYCTETSLIDFKPDITQVQELSEALVLLQFYEMANLQGIRVPRPPLHHLGTPFEEAQLAIKDWMSPGWMELAALAQHYGLPTRMLDWTYDLTTALYFVARGFVKGSTNECATVWQMDMAKVSFLTKDVRFVVPEYALNPNLHAQKGLLTCLRNTSGSQDESLDEYLIRIYDSKSDGFKKLLMSDGSPILKCINIPHEQIQKILFILDQRLLMDSRYFPGLSGIADEILDRSKLD